MHVANSFAKFDVASAEGRGSQLGSHVMQTSSLAVVLQAALRLRVALVVVSILVQASMPIIVLNDTLALC